jgi:hypothetical protein
MSVTGHKSESSLKTYSGKTCEKNKKFERACNSNEDALLVLAPVFSSTSTVILLWDKARKSILSGRESCSEILLDNASVGHNKLGTFMTEISRMTKLSREYTNHSCRATTVHVLDEAQVPSRHIMSVTGHRVRVKPENILWENM